VKRRPVPPNLEALEETRRLARQSPEAVRGGFSVVTDWQEGTRTIARSRGFLVATDEPVALGGTDQAPDPMELLLAALGSCLTIGWVKQAELRHVTLRHLRITVHAPYDLRGYLGVDAETRPGFSELSYSVDLECDATPAQIEEIRLAAERASPLMDNIRHATPLSGRVNPQALA
jgi:putative redox protein